MARLGRGYPRRATIIRATLPGVVPVPSGAGFLTDTFTGSGNLSAHTSDSGHTWSGLAGGYDPANEITLSGGYAVSGLASNVYKSSATPPSADYDVTAVCRFTTLVNGANCGGGPRGRWSDTGPTGYYTYVTADGAIALLRYGGTGTGTLASTTVTAVLGSGLVINTDYTLKLQMRGTAIKVFLNGTQALSVTETSITATGVPGLTEAGSAGATEFKVDSITATDSLGGTTFEAGTATETATVTNSVTPVSASDSGTGTVGAGVVTQVIRPSSTGATLQGSRVTVADTTATGHQFNGFNGFCVTNRGTYLANLDVADAETSGPDYGTIIRRSTDGGATWSTAKTFTQAGGDCSMFTLASGTVYATWINVFGADVVPSVSGDFGVFNTYWSKSTDDGVTWTTPAILDCGVVPARDASSGLYTLGASPGVEAPDGTVLLPIYRRTTSSLSDLDFYVICRGYGADFSSGVNRGTPFPYIAGWRFEEPCMTYRPDGVLLCAARTTEPGGIASIWMNSSLDNGVTWQTPRRVLGAGTTGTFGYGGRANIWCGPDGLIYILLRVMVWNGSSQVSGSTAYSTSTDGYTWATPKDALTGGTQDTTTQGPGGTSSSAMSVYGAWATTGPADTAGNVAAIYSVETSTDVGKLYLQKFTASGITGQDAGAGTEGTSNVQVVGGSSNPTASDSAVATETATAAIVGLAKTATDSGLASESASLSSGPALVTVTASDTAVATETALAAIASAQIVLNTTLASAQYGSTTLTSAQDGSTTVTTAASTVIS